MRKIICGRHTNIMLSFKDNRDRGLTFGLSFGIPFVILFILLFCTIGFFYYHRDRCCVQQPLVQTHGIEAILSADATTVVIPSQTRSFTTLTSVAASYSTQQSATVNDTTQPSQEAPPSYDVVSDFPSIQKVHRVL